MPPFPIRFRFLACVLGLSLLPARAADAPAHVVLAIQDTETKQERDARMGWWREARFGMFVHWGDYAVAGGVWKGQPIGGGGEWLLAATRAPIAEYKAMAAKFNPTAFNADAWVSLVKAAGMKYIVITAKHHDGFAMFKSDADPYNIVDATPYRRDPLRALVDACHRQGIKIGFYYSQNQDWTAPGGAALFGHWDAEQDGSFDTYLHRKAIPQIKELLANYQPAPDIFWFDTPMYVMTPDRAGEIVSILNRYPHLIWNNRLGGGYPGDTETPEQEIPDGQGDRDGEVCMTINETWGYKSTDTKFKSAEALLHNLIDIASKGCNYLLNVGPDATGVIPAPEAERLRTIGAWLKVNGTAIYGTHASPFAAQPAWGRYTRKGNTLYLHVFQWSADKKLLVPVGNRTGKASLLATGKSLPVAAQDGGLEIALPATAPDAVASVIVLQLDDAPHPLPQTSKPTP